MLDKRTHKGKVQYLLRWEGWAEEFDSWQYLQDIPQRSRGMVNAFNVAARVAKGKAGAPASARAPAAAAAAPAAASSVRGGRGRGKGAARAPSAASRGRGRGGAGACGGAR